MKLDKITNNELRDYHAFVTYFMIKRKSINVFLQMIEADLKLYQSGAMKKIILSFP